jgi:hypothetical protein
VRSRVLAFLFGPEIRRAEQDCFGVSCSYCDPVWKSHICVVHSTRESLNDVIAHMVEKHWEELQTLRAVVDERNETNDDFGTSRVPPPKFPYEHEDSTSAPHPRREGTTTDPQ